MQILRRMVRTLLGRERRLDEIDEELAFHFDERKAALVESGMNEKDSARKARRLVGNSAALRDQVDRADTLGWLTDFVREIGFAARSLRRRRALSATVVLSLALSLAAVSALFGFVDALFLRAIPLPHPEAVIALQESFHGEAYGSNPARMRDWAAQVPGLATVAGSYSDGAVLTGEGPPARVTALRTFGDIMAILGEAPAEGRGFTPAEAAGNGPAVALLTHAFYAAHFAAEGVSPADALGRVLRLNGTPYTIIGIMAAGRDFPPETDVITPAPLAVQVVGRNAGFLGLFARLRDGVTIAEVQGQLETVNHRLALAYPASDTGRGIQAQSVRDQFGQGSRRPVLLLFAAALLLLLLANVNVATLLLNRAFERQQEAAIRLSIGAGRGSLVRLYLYESLLLALAGGLLGVAGGRALFAVFLHMLPERTALPTQPVFDYRIAFFGLGLAMLSGLVFGLVPAVQIAGTATARLMATRQVTGSRRQLLGRQALVMVQVALSMLLLTGVALTARSLYRVRSEPLGFEPAQTVSVSVSYPWDVRSSKLRAVTAAALAGLAREPEVISAGLIDRLPLGGDTQTNTIRLEGRPLTPELETLAVAGRAYAGDYFATMGIPVIAGRLPHRQAEGDSPEIAVNQTFAQRFFPQGDAIGHRILDHQDVGKTSDKVDRRIVGIVGDTRVSPTQAAEPAETFLLAENTYWPYLTYVAKVRTASATTLAGVRAAVQQADPEQIVTGPTALAATVATASGDEQNRLVLLALFGGFALLLSCVGLYGVLSGEVTRRTREIGLRLALGASRGRVLTATLRAGLVMTVAGLVAGSLVSFLVGRLIAKELYGVEPTDLLSWTATTSILLLVGIGASLLPARKAASVNPMEALRLE